MTGETVHATSKQSPLAIVSAMHQELQAMQKRVHDYVVADQGTAQEALDQLVQDWTEVFEDAGKI